MDDKDNFISRKDTVVWKKWQGGDGTLSITLPENEKISGAVYCDLSLQERTLSCELKDAQSNTYKITLPAGLLEDFGFIKLFPA